GGIWFDRGFGLRRRRNRAILRFVRQERERHAEDVHVLRIEESRFGIDFVSRATKPAAYHLLAEKLARERAQTHDVRHSLRIPALREHADGYHVLNLLTRLAALTDRVNLLAQHFGLLFLRQFALRRAVLVVPILRLVVLSILFAVLFVVTFQLRNRFFRG